MSDLKVRNQDITAAHMADIRALNDFDLRMFLSEIHDHGWPVAVKLLPHIAAATAVHGQKR